MSFGRRLDLIEHVQGLGARLEYLRAGESAAERLEGAKVQRQLDLLYLRWGVAGIEGLLVDGAACDLEMAIERGPEALCVEMAEQVKLECHLQETERKN